MDTEQDAKQRFNKPSAGAPRDAASLWPWMRGWVLLSALAYMITSAASAATAAVVAHLISVEMPVATVIDATTKYGAIAVAVLFYISAFVVLRVTFRLVEAIRDRGDEQDFPTPWWSVWAYIIPIVSLFAPPQIMSRVWEATYPNEAERPKGGTFISWWWPAYLLGALIFGVLNVQARQNSDLASGAAFWWLHATAYGLRGLSALLLLRVYGPLVNSPNRVQIDASVFD